MNRCPVEGCSKLFMMGADNEEALMNAHMERDHSDNYQCDQCEKLYHTKWEFKKHQLSHRPDDEKPYRWVPFMISALCGQALPAT